MPVLPELIGGRACLDLADTVGPRRPAPGTEPHDRVPDYRALVRWAVHAGALTPAEEQHLLGAAESDPARARAVHRDAVRLREATYAVFAAVADGRAAPADALAVVHDAHVAALRHAQLAPTASGMDWRWPDRGPLEQVVWPFARSAADLAVHGPLDRVKRCPGDDGRCGWLFLDTTKSNTRRWCSMRTCGGREKSQRQVARMRSSRATR